MKPSSLLPYATLLRPLQWSKNVFVLAPLFFSRNLTDSSLFLRSLAMFVTFCLISSAVYCVNDIADVEADRANPYKNTRPLASGALSLSAAKNVAVACLLLASVPLLALFAYIGSVWLFVPILIYLILNIVYSLCLKRYAIIDIVCISAGFVLRVIAGGQATNIMVSHWIVIMTFLLALFLALSKRLGEINQGSTYRDSIKGYDTAFVQLALSVMATLILVCYILYTLDSQVIQHIGTPYLYTTAVWVLAGLLRYTQLIMVFHRTDGPTTIVFHDPLIMACILGWLLCYAIFIYVL